MDWSAWELDNLQYAGLKPEASALLRAIPEDFQVDEVLGFEPSGEGEHLFLQIQKRGQNTVWVAEQLAKAIGVSPNLVSYSGLKDRHALTSQWFSVHLPKRELPDLSAFWQENIILLEQTWNDRKLKRGAHQGNRFDILLRAFEGDKATVDAVLQRILKEGVPNYFGLQRFGRDQQNLSAGAALLQQTPRKRLSNRESLALSAVRSAFFNRVLSERITQKTWQNGQDGDVLMLDGRHSFFVPEQWDEDIKTRLQQLSIHATGPLYGKGKVPVTGLVLELENEIAAQTQGLVDSLLAFGVEQQRRALRLHVQNLEWQWQNNTDTTDLLLSFTLTSGSFATAVLRELVLLREQDHAFSIE